MLSASCRHEVHASMFPLKIGSTMLNDQLGREDRSFFFRSQEKIEASSTNDILILPPYLSPNEVVRYSRNIFRVIIMRLIPSNVFSCS